ncbi:MAG: aminoglycoside 6-adenylyltransferase [Anaerolineae bacterium]|nr:aminoglycoside 6-adenylyltransferase [Anaerolineae bacterium]
MRNEQEMLDLIIGTAENDERIRAAIMNGSRANPNAPGDIFQDFDIVYIVTEVAPFRNDRDWINRFGEMMIMQLPDDMQDPPPSSNDGFTYLMQFADGNRIDLGLFPIARLDEFPRDSLSLLLLDKDGIIEPFAPPSERDYLPQPPAAKAFFDCCNEFWWVCPYVAKGLWRQEIVYARYMFDQVIRPQLVKMLTWYVGVKTGLRGNPGAYGKYLGKYLEPELWAMLQKTYADAGYEHTWDALFAMVDLFRTTAVAVAMHLGFEYLHGDDERVSSHLGHVRLLPKDAREIY